MSTKSLLSITTVLFPIPIEFCVLDWILMVQALCFLPHHPATNTWKSGTFMCMAKAQSCPMSSETNHFKSQGYSNLSLCNNTVNPITQLCYFTSVIITERSSQDIVTTTWVILTHPSRAGNSMWTTNSFYFMVL